MALLDVFKRKREVELPLPGGPAAGPAFRPEQPLPSELELFRIGAPSAAPMTPRQPEPYSPAPMYGPPPEPYRPLMPVPAAPPTDKLDLILSKLETIDARLRVIEEKLERKGSTMPSAGLSMF